MNSIPCNLVMNSPLDGYVFTPIECKSISEAIRIATSWKCPYRIFDTKGNLIKSGWKK